MPRSLTIFILGGGGILKLYFRIRVFCRIWTKISTTPAGSCITDSLSHTTYVETNEAFHPCDTIFTARQLSCSKIIFLHLSVILSGGGCLCMMSLPVWLDGGLCPRSHVPSREVSMKESLCEGGLCEGGLCERGFFERGFL